RAISVIALVGYVRGRGANSPADSSVTAPTDNSTHSHHHRPSRAYGMSSVPSQPNTHQQAKNHGSTPLKSATVAGRVIGAHTAQNTTRNQNANRSLRVLRLSHPSRSIPTCFVI